MISFIQTLFHLQLASGTSALLVGTMMGFCIAIPPGPVSVTALVRSTWGNHSAALALGLGAAVGEIFYAGLGFFGAPLLADSGLDLPLRCAGLLLISVLGVRYAFGHGIAPRTVPGTHAAQSAALGLSLSLTTPTIGAVYMVAAGLVRREGWVDAALATDVFAALGAGIGSFLWILVLIAGGRALAQERTDRVVSFIARFAGILLLCAAVTLAIRLAGDLA